MTNAFARLHAATTVIRDDATWPTPLMVSETAVCTCCGRLFGRVEDRNRAIAYRYSHTEVVQHLCTTCYTPKHGSFTALGIGRTAGKKKEPVPGMLGMLMSSGGVITTNNVLHLALKEKPFARYKAGHFGRQGQVHQCSPLALLLALRRDGRLGDPKEGILYIGMFGTKSLSLMGNLRLTRDLRETWINSDSWPEAMDLSSLLDVAEWVIAHDQTDAACKPSFWRPINDAARGRFDRSALENWAKKTPGAADLVKRLPKDPHDRLGLHLRMKDLLGA